MQKLALSFVIVCSTLSALPAVANNSTDELTALVHAAIDHDQGQRQSQFDEHALRETGKAANTWMNPQISVMAANLPIDYAGNFDINNEGMTQLKASITQMLPRGQSLALQETMYQQLADSQPIKRLERASMIEQQVRLRYLQALKTAKSQHVIQQNEALFAQLLRLSENNYRLGFRQTDSQDIVAAELQLLRLDDRLLQLRQQLNSQLSQLNELLPIAVSAEHVLAHADSNDWPSFDPALLQRYQSQLNEPWTDQELNTLLRPHPMVAMIEPQLRAKQTQMQLADESNKAQWGVTASYAYRFDTPMDTPRSDLFSLGVMVELPLFSKQKSSAQRNSALAQSDSLAAQQALTLQTLRAQARENLAQWQQNQRRQTLYATQLLQKAAEQSQSALNAYTNGEGTFKDVVAASQQELELALNRITLDAQQQLLLSQFHYLFAPSHATQTGAAK